MPATPSNSEVLHARMEITCGGLYATYRRFWHHPELGRRLPAFFMLMHQIVRASVPLLNAARAVAEERASVDCLCRDLLPYFAQHAAEERHHDEWLLEDLEAAGIPRDDIAGGLPPPSVASLVGAQYYWVRHHHPVALLGYMRVLEGNPPSESHIARLEQASGFPPSMFRTYRLHGQLDPHHVAEMDHFLDSLSLSTSQGNLIWVSASHTARALADCLRQIAPDISRARSHTPASAPTRLTR